MEYIFLEKCWLFKKIYAGKYALKITFMDSFFTNTLVGFLNSQASNKSKSAHRSANAAQQSYPACGTAAAFNGCKDARNEYGIKHKLCLDR